jgi:hypothetical protein
MVKVGSQLFDTPLAPSKIVRKRKEREHAGKAEREPAANAARTLFSDGHDDLDYLLSAGGPPPSAMMTTDEQRADDVIAVPVSGASDHQAEGPADLVVADQEVELAPATQEVELAASDTFAPPGAAANFLPAVADPLPSTGIPPEPASEPRGGAPPLELAAAALLDVEAAFRGGAQHEPSALAAKATEPEVVAAPGDGLGTTSDVEAEVGTIGATEITGSPQTAATRPTDAEDGAIVKPGPPATPPAPPPPLKALISLVHATTKTGEASVRGMKFVLTVSGTKLQLRAVEDNFKNKVPKDLLGFKFVYDFKGTLVVSVTFDRNGPRLYKMFGHYARLALEQRDPVPYCEGTIPGGDAALALLPFTKKLQAACVTVVAVRNKPERFIVSVKELGLSLFQLAQSGGVFDALDQEKGSWDGATSTRKYWFTCPEGEDEKVAEKVADAYRKEGVIVYREMPSSGHVDGFYGYTESP